MTRLERTVWAWSEACSAMERAARLRHEFFGRGGSPSSPVWQPPIDMFEIGGKIVVLVALPGVDAKSIEVSFERGLLSVFGYRAFPPELRHAEIRRLEIPWGRIARRIVMPNPNLRTESCALADGCLRIVLARIEERVS